MLVIKINNFLGKIPRFFYGTFLFFSPIKESVLDDEIANVYLYRQMHLKYLSHALFCYYRIYGGN
ncbi:hypothetical protein ACFLWR_04490 [Chloroflexota bacterium]